MADEKGHETGYSVKNAMENGNLMNCPLPIDNLNDVCFGKFSTDYLSCGRPVVLRGFANKWPAISWTFENLKDRVGDNSVYVRRNTSSENYKVGKQYNIETMTFGKYIDNIVTKSKKSLDCYLAVQNMKQSFPQLLTDLIIPPLVGKLHGGPYLWIARGGHYEFCHIDPDDNLLIVLEGQKVVRLYGCDEKSMYPNPLGSKGKTIQSQVNCDSPNYEKFPLHKSATCYECTLNPGDVLFNPAFWWHQVSSPKDTISINMFFGESGSNTYLTKIMSTDQRTLFLYWLLNIIEQNRETEQFKRVLQHLPHSLKCFFMKQWHEVPDDEQLKELVDIILDYCGVKNTMEFDYSKPNIGKHPPQLKIRGLLWRT